MYHYEYKICNQTDEEIFKKQCAALEKNIPNLIKSDLLVDVDNSKIQRYNLNDDKIVVYNNYNVGAVYIKSDIDIEPYFKA